MRDDHYTDIFEDIALRICEECNAFDSSCERDGPSSFGCHLSGYMQELLEVCYKAEQIRRKLAYEAAVYQHDDTYEDTYTYYG